MTTAYDSGKIPAIEPRHRLRIAREAAELEQKALATLIGVDRNTISNAESGRTKPRRLLLNAWALATGVPVTWLLTGEAPAPEGPGGGEASLPTDSNRGPSLYKGGGTGATVTELFPAVSVPVRRAA